MKLLNYFFISLFFTSCCLAMDNPDNSQQNTSQQMTELITAIKNLTVEQKKTHEEQEKTNITLQAILEQQQKISEVLGKNVKISLQICTN